MGHTKNFNRAYTINSTSDLYLLFENVTAYNYKISYPVYIITLVSSLHNSDVQGPICKRDLLPLKGWCT